MLPEISRRCSSCGASIRERDALFCAECGKPLPTNSKADEDSVQSPAASQTDETVNATQADESVNATQVDESVNASQAPEPANAKDGSEAELPAEQTSPSSDTTERPQQPTPPVGLTEKRERSPQTEGDGAKTEQNVAARPHPGMAERTRETLHRASTVARGVIEDEVKRVEKIRHVSSVVIEEASYDPSLRFVLVAVALFIVFIILLVLSKVMG